MAAEPRSRMKTTKLQSCRFVLEATMHNLYTVKPNVSTKDKINKVQYNLTDFDI